MFNVTEKDLLVMEDCNWDEVYAFMAEGELYKIIKFDDEEASVKMAKFVINDQNEVSLEYGYKIPSADLDYCQIYMTHDMYHAVANEYNGNMARAHQRIMGEFCNNPELYDFTTMNILEEETIMMNTTVEAMTTNNKEEVVMNNTKGTKVMVNVINGELVVTGIKGRIYNAIPSESYVNYISEFQSEIQELNLKVNKLEEVNEKLNVRIEKAVKYFEDNRAILTGNSNKVETPKANITPVDNVANGIKPVTQHTGYVCKCCGKEVSKATRDYCASKPEFFDDVYCYKCQRVHARRLA